MGCTRARLFAALALALSAAVPTNAVVRYVDARSSSPSPDGTSWSNAFPTLQAAAPVTKPGDEVWVAAGKYGGASIALVSGATLYGGFDGSETARDARDSARNATVLNCPIYTSGSNTPIPTTIDGFTVTPATGASNVGIQVSTGGAIAISHNLFTGFTGSGSGGAIRAQGCRATIQNNVFRGNLANLGGAIYASDYVYSDNSIAAPTLTLRNNVFDGNTARNEGGAIYCIDAVLRASDNVFVKNTASRGPVVSSLTSAVTFTNNTVVANLATYPNQPYATLLLSGTRPVTLANNIFAYNGVVLQVGSGTTTIHHNAFYRNAGYVMSGGTLPLTDSVLADPHFADIVHGDWHIQPDSPCRDAGDDSVTQVDETDADGQPRIQNAHVDIGADESDGTAYTPAPQSIVRVSPAGDDANDGSTWPLAKRTISAALAQAGAGGGEVWVSAGTFAERVTVPAYVTLYGGFSGKEATRAERNVSANVTTLNGSAGGPVVTIRGAAAGGVDGFTITNGVTANTNTASAVHCESAMGIVAHNTIWGCTTPAILVTGAGSPVLLNNIVRDNTLGYGAAVISGSYVSPIIANNLIARNTSIGLTVQGAGTVANNTIVYSAGTSGTANVSTTTTTTASFINNIVAFGPGYGFSGTARPNLSRNCVYGNKYGPYGGFSYSSDPDPNLLANPRLANPAGADPHIEPDSPCINAGDAAVVQPDWTDIDGQTRVRDGIVDIGADESDGTVWPPFTIRVKPDGNDSNNGLTWEAAKKKIQSAIDAVALVGGGDVWVAAGTYSGRIQPKTDVILYGGFAGTETTRDQRDFQRNVTILDGGTAYDTVVYVTQGISTTIDGFTVRNGRGHEASLASNDDWGGGFFLDRATVTLRNNTVTGNYSTHGGGICAKGGVANLLNNTVKGNSGLAGSGIAYYSGAAGTIAGNTISANLTPASMSSVTANGGGILCSASSPTITGNLVVGNGVPRRAPSTYTTALTGLSTAGGGIAVSGTPAPLIASNTFTGNMAASGGGISISTSPVRVVDNVFVSNWGNIGGAVFVSGTGGVIANNTIVNNAAGTDGAALATSGAAPIVANNLIAFNTSGVYNSTSTSQPTFSANDVFSNNAYAFKGTADPTGQGGNVAVDPQFASLQFGNLHLQPGSPLVDAGGDSAVLPGESDMDRQQRVQGAHVDIGAYESNGTTWTSAPTVIRVSPHGDDSRDGSSWDQAKATVSAAIDALPNGGGEVWVAAGTYSGPVTLGAFTWMYGGFSGSETTRDARDPARWLTILDGRGLSSTVCARSTAFGAIDGFTIRGGYGIPISYSVYYNVVAGGGVCLQSASVKVVNNTIEGNAADIGTGLYTGPAVWNTSGYPALGGSPVITGNRIRSNRTISSSGTSGGGIYAAGAARIADNVIIGNTAALGSGMSLSGPATVTNNTIVANSDQGTASNYAGAIAVALTPDPTILGNNIVARNASGIFTYNIQNYSTGTLPGVPAVVRFNDVFGNTASNYRGITDPTGSAGNISSEPFLANPDQGNLHIQPMSPCRDAGDNAYVAAGETDMDGQSRIVGSRVDIGADESDLRIWKPISMVVHVRPDGDDANNGGSWPAAKRTIQSAVDSLAGSGGEIWVARGVYTERVTLNAFVHVLGGFSGSEAIATQRNWTANPTIVDARQSGTVIEAPAYAASASVDGLTIRGGNADFGAAMHWMAANGEVAHNLIAGNTSPGSVSSSSLCSGLYIGAGPVNVHDNVIAGNIAVKSGSAIYASAAATIVNNTVVANQTPTGSAVNLYHGTTATFANNIVAFNSSGGMSATGNVTSFKANCVYGNPGGNYAGMTDPAGLGGNIGLDPRFADSANGDYHLLSSSPCVDAGDDSTVATGGTDLGGAPRIRSRHVDMGAFETPGPRVPTGLTHGYVRSDGDDGADGATWATAKKTVQAALDAVASPGGEVWVSAGTYAQNVVLPEGVGLYGGFSGSEALRELRDPLAHLTILDGGGNGSVVVVRLNATPATVLDGFTIQNGAGYTVNKRTSGGGVLADGASPTIRNNRILSNGALYGGGIFLSGSAGAVVEGNVIEDNKGTDTAGSTGCGSGLYALNATVSIRGNTFSGNMAANSNTVAGGAIGLQSSTAEVTGNTILLNSGVGGGGIFVGGGQAMITRNLIARNDGINQGGGVYAASATLDLRDNLIAGNHAADQYSSGDSGLGSGVLLEKMISANVVGNTIVANTGPHGAVATRYSTGSFLNNIIAFNDSGAYRAQGDTVSAAYRNNDFYQNSAFDVSGLTGVLGAGGNLNADPILADLDNGNYHIQPNSPCRDAGEDAAVRAGETDIDGQPRIQGAHTDIGADESDGTNWVATPKAVRVSPSGNDANDGTTWGNAKKTIQGALDSLTSGGEIWVASGTYQERITLGNKRSVYGGFSGTETDRTQRMAGAPLTILDGTTGTAAGVVVIPANASGCVLDGLGLRNGSAGVIGGANAMFEMRRCEATGNATGISIDSGSTVSITQTAVTANTLGIQATNVHSLVIANCRVVGNTGTATFGTMGGMSITGDTVALTDNLIAGNTGTQVGGLRLTMATATLRNNTIVANQATDGGAIYVTSPGSLVLVNNIVALNSSGVFGTAGVTIDYRNNCFYGNGSYDINGLPAPLPEGGNLQADPKFAGAAIGDFHIQPDSPCREAGTDYGIMPGETDVDGRPRVIGASADIGAFESDGTVWPATRTIHVRADGDDANDGSSWALARKTIPEAVGGEIWVARGTYGPVVLGPFASLYGGFSGTESDPLQRDGTAVTIIDANQQASGITILGGTMPRTVDGFTIRNASAENSLFVSGGVSCSYAIATISHNTILDTGGSSANGISCQNSVVDIAANTIARTNTSLGGGISATNGSGTIRGNVLDGNGGGISAGGYYSVLGNTISNNYGTGLSLTSGVALGNTVVHNTVTFGVVYGGPGTLFANNIIAGNSDTSGTSPTITAGSLINNTVVYNTSEYGPVGISCSGVVANNIVAFNTSINTVGCISGSPQVFSHNDIYGNVDHAGNSIDFLAFGNRTGTDGNISADPRFLTGSAGSLHLTDGSACIDAGDDTEVQPGWTDIDGEARTSGGHVDIGADEWNGTIFQPEWRVVRVSPSGNDANDGADWSTAMRTIQAAADSAALYGGEVWVLGGTYAEKVSLSPYASLYGGFGGFEVARDQRNAKAYPTEVHSPDELGADITMNGGHAVSTVDGFTVHHNGIDAEAGFPVIANCTLSTTGIYGGGTVATIRSNTIQGAGKGIDWRGGRCTVANNVITGCGGGIEFESSGEILNNVITDNNGQWGGGIDTGFGGPVTIANNLIARNSAWSGGGGLEINGSGPIKLYNNTIVGNTAPQGGALEATNQPEIAFANNIVTGNNPGLQLEYATTTFSRNTIYSNTTYDIQGATVGSPGNFGSHVNFVNQSGGDFHLSAGSPGIDAGDDTVVWDGEMDLDGRSRFIGTHVDLGAYEYTSAVPTTMSDAIRALRVAAGFAVAGTADKQRLNIEPLGSSAGKVDIQDAIRLVRRAAGRDLNP